MLLAVSYELGDGPLGVRNLQQRHPALALLIGAGRQKHGDRTRLGEDLTCPRNWRVKRRRPDSFGSDGGVGCKHRTDQSPRGPHGGPRDFGRELGGRESVESTVRMAAQRVHESGGRWKLVDALRDEGVDQQDSCMRWGAVAAPLVGPGEPPQVRQRDDFAELPVEFAQRADLLCEHRKVLPMNVVKTPAFAWPPRGKPQGSMAKRPLRGSASV